MPQSKQAQAVLASTIDAWFKNFAGSSALDVSRDLALDVSRDLALDHSLVMQLFEELVKEGNGSIKPDVTLYQVSFDSETILAAFKHEPVVTHIFFPSRQVLRDAFYSSDRPMQRMPEYTTRLHLGANQIGLAYFAEEVLARYLVHRELYEINDSLAGGDVSALSGTPEERYLYVRYGKCQLKSGNIAVTAIFKDLSVMALSEQRHWHSFEIESPDLDKSDAHFQNFLARTYEGEFVDFDDPITRVLEGVEEVNNLLKPDKLFVNVQNMHLRLPVEQTYKSYCDAASELYKILGPDSLSQSILKNILTKDFCVEPNALVNAKSERPMSSLQLLSLLEDKLEAPGVLTKQLGPLKELRVVADHKILKVDAETRSYSREFGDLCNKLAESLKEFARLLSDRRQ